MSTIFCNNCGLKGHAFRECNDPILSCGIILIRNRESPHNSCPLPIDVKNIEVLMVRRRDSMSYTEFMRGRYEASDHAYVKTLLENMTQSELHKLKCEPFEALWTKLWAHAERHEQELKISKEKYDCVRHLIEDAVSCYTEPEWGFPKGRRFRSESDDECAEREFKEETNIARNAFILIKGVRLEETFPGTNNVMYRHRYFVGLVSNPTTIDIHQKFTNMQKREISAIGWKTLTDCMTLTRPHYTERNTMLQALASMAQTFEVRIPKE